MVAASFLIIGNTIFTSNGNTTCLAASASIGLYGIWLFGLHLTAKRVDNISFARLRVIEKEIRNNGYYYFGIHTFLNSTFKESKIEKIWIEFRRRFWGWTYIFLSLYWMYISGIVRCLLVTGSFGVIVFPYPVYRIIKIVYRKIRKIRP